MSRATLYRRMTEGLFPKPMQSQPHNQWSRDQLEGWLSYLDFAEMFPEWGKTSEAAAKAGLLGEAHRRVWLAQRLTVRRGEVRRVFETEVRSVWNAMGIR